MDHLEELETTAGEVLGKLKTHQLFQSQWDTAAFIIFLIFLGECGLCIWPASLSCQAPGRGPCLDTHPTPRHRGTPAAVCLHPLLLLLLPFVQIPEGEFRWPLAGQGLLWGEGAGGVGLQDLL